MLMRESIDHNTQLMYWQETSLISTDRVQIPVLVLMLNAAPAVHSGASSNMHEKLVYLVSGLQAQSPRSELCGSPWPDFESLSFQISKTV